MLSWIVTGASRGLGRALALQLAQRGYRVFACARDAGALEALAAAAPARLHPVCLDLSRPEQIASAFGQVLAQCGELGGVVNNAGIGWYKPFLQHSEAELAELVQVNLLAVMQISRLVLPTLIAQGRGHLVNIGSDLGRRPLANMAPYVASKHALTGFSHSLLREVRAQGVRVSLVNPGIIDTDFGGGSGAGSRDERQYLKPDAVAALIVQLIEQPGYQLVDELSLHPLGQDDF